MVCSHCSMSAGHWPMGSWAGLSFERVPAFRIQVHFRGNAGFLRGKLWSGWEPLLLPIRCGRHLKTARHFVSRSRLRTPSWWIKRSPTR
jgi:hypothetical protein